MTVPVALTAILVMCLVFAFLRLRVSKRRSLTASGTSRLNATRLLRPHDDREIIDHERQAVLRLYPVLHRVPCISPPDGMIPLGADALHPTTSDRMAEQIHSLAVLQAHTGRLLNLLRDPESNPGEISAIVSTNPLFSAKLLQTVNSVYFNLSHPITSVGRAITLLGYNNVRSLVLQDALRGMFAGGQDSTDPHARIWVHSAIVSACSGYLGKKIFGLSEYELATVGLLHDIGKYCIDVPANEGSQNSPLPSLMEEEQAYGFNHALMGALMTQKWGLPPSVSRAIAYHHHPSFGPPASIPNDCLRQSLVISISDLIALLLDYEATKGDILAIREEYFTRFGLDRDPASLVTPFLIKEAHKARSIVETYTTFSSE